MNPIFLLMISALVSVHQYIPTEDGRFHKYFNDAREVKPEEIFPAANQSCQYLYSVFVDAGLEATIGNSNPLSNMLSSMITSQSGFQSVLNMVNNPKIAKKLNEKNVDPKDLQNLLDKICSTDFNPLIFTPSQRQEVVDFIQKEVAVLSEDDLNGLGESNIFGNTKVYDAKDRLVGQIGSENKTWTPISKISPTLVLALIAAEDEGFFSHRGVNTKSIARMGKEFASSDRTTGGSTLTMQLLKNLYFSSGPKSQYPVLNSGESQAFLRKVREWYWAWPLEKTSSNNNGKLAGKKEVLERYFNKIFWGPNIEGINQATHVYFGKSPKDLNLAEAAYMVTLLKAPSRYSNPSNYVEDTLPRRNDYVLGRVKKLCSAVKSDNSEDEFLTSLCQNPVSNNTFTTEEIENFKKEELPTWDRPQRYQFDETMNTVRIFTANWLNQFAKTSDEVVRDLKVQTTVDQKLQEKVSIAVKRKLDEYDKELQQLSYIDQARDDRSRYASIRAEDLGYRNAYRLNRLTAKMSDKDNIVLSSVTLGLIKKETKNGKVYYVNKISLPEKDIRDALKKLGWSNVDTNIETSKILSILNSRQQRVAVLKFLRIERDTYDFFEVDDVQELMSWSDDENEAFLSRFSRNKIEETLHGNTLRRLDRHKHRSFLTPVVVNDRGLILDKDLNQIKLTPNHNWWFKEKLSIANKFYWARNARTGSDGTPEYELDAPRLQAAAIVLDANTGAVLANFGGYDLSGSYLDRSVKSERQIGSTIKPWVYLTALNKGLHPDDTLINDWVSFIYNKGYTVYTPKNFSRSPNLRPTFRESLVNSYNIATMSLLKDPRWGNEETSWYDNFQDLRTVLNEIGLYDETKNFVPITIGAQETSLLRLASTYTYFANGLSIVEPYFISKAMDHRGRQVYQSEVQRKFLFNQNPTALFNMQLLLADIANSGTARSLNSFTSNFKDGLIKDRCFRGIPATGKQSCFGGKTGTTNLGKDAWFIGFSKNFVIGVWVGYDENIPIPTKATGGERALPIFKEIIKEAYNELPSIEPFVGLETMPVGMDFRAGDAFARNDWQPSESTPRPTSINNTATTTISSAMARCRCIRRGRTYYLNYTYRGKTTNYATSAKDEKTCKKASVMVGGRDICVW